MNMLTRGAIAALASLSLAAACVQVDPASAETTTFDVDNTYLRSVTVANADASLRVTIKVNKGRKIKVPSYSAEIDTIKDRRGAEFLVSWYTGTRPSIYVAIEGEEGSYDSLECDGFKVTRLKDRVSRRFDVPRACLTFDETAAAQVRVSVDGLGIKKRANGEWGCHPFHYPRRGFTPWVAQGDASASSVGRSVGRELSARRGC